MEVQHGSVRSPPYICCGLYSTSFCWGIPVAGAAKSSKAEETKRLSHGLRGALTAELAGPESHFAAAEQLLLKFHGTYQGYDRDSATELKQQGLEKQWEFMVRAKIPGGRLTPEQYLALDALAERHGGGNLRITTRQGVQFHGIIKRDLKATIAAINRALLTTFAACGDVVRNVTATPAPIADAVHRRLQADAKMLSEELAPKTNAYHEIWLDGEAVAGEVDEPLYGPSYLPRKFKIGLATPEDNSIDVLTNDLGIIALFEGERLVGYNLALGGGLGMTHNKPKTYPRLATPIAFIEPDGLLAGVKAVIQLQRDHGDRADRKHARLKYLVQENGVDWTRATLEGIFCRTLADPKPMPPFRVIDHTGWHEQGDGRWYFGLAIANGRVKDEGSLRLRTALRTVIQRFRPTPILTPGQGIILGDVDAADRAEIEAVLSQHGVSLPHALKPIARWALACPALPSCGLALNEAERIRVPLIAEIEAVLVRHGLGDEEISVRITGCPNGCARPYAGDIGIVGRTPREYALYLGGDFAGTRLNRLVFERIDLAEIAATLEPLFEAFARDRWPGEGFGDFCHRRSNAELIALVDAARPPAARVA
ncbi:MAG: NADPH-dependent assimilatory sulfite reductase hemoprotein subunit [Proteobacteria bacterium]|nr:NADPH-dependent assimilatory sulfite reductase hemoprotein subunit [Pseudomonadota bacterium]